MGQRKQKAKRIGRDTWTSGFILVIIFVLIVGSLFVFGLIHLPAEFYSSFAGALAALIFSALVSYYFWQKTRKQSKDTKAQIIQSLLGEVELNLNNVANFIKGCNEGTYFTPFVTATAQKNLFWPRFLIDYPHPSFELTQFFDLIYAAFYLMEFYANQAQIRLPENLRFIPPVGIIPPPEGIQQAIRTAVSGDLSIWKSTVQTIVGYYEEILEALNNQFKGYEYKRQLYFEQNKTYEKLRSFFTGI